MSILFMHIYLNILMYVCANIFFCEPIHAHMFLRVYRMYVCTSTNFCKCVCLCVWCVGRRGLVAGTHLFVNIPCPCPSPSYTC